MEAYRQASIRRWGEWLFEGTDEVGFLGRKVSLRGLSELAEIDLAAALGTSRVPVLLLHGVEDTWTPVGGARAVDAALRAAGLDAELRVYDGLGADLGATTDRPFAPEVSQDVFAWLAQRPLPD